MWVSQGWLILRNIRSVDGTLTAAVTEASDQQGSWHLFDPVWLVRQKHTFAYVRSDTMTAVMHEGRGQAVLQFCEPKLPHWELSRKEGCKRTRQKTHIHYLWLSAIRATWMTTSFSMGPCKRHKIERSFNTLSFSIMQPLCDWWELKWWDEYTSECGRFSPVWNGIHRKQLRTSRSLI